MSIDYTDPDVRKGKLNVNAGGEDFTVNVSIPVNLFIRSGDNGTVQLGSGNDIVQDYGTTGEVTIRMDGGNDQAFIGKGVTGHVVLVGGTGNDVLINASSAHVDFVYNFNTVNTVKRSGDGADGIKGFVIGQDHVVLNNITQQEFQNTFVVTDAPNSVGVVITDGTDDGWSVQLIGIHETKADLAAHAFVFA
jgi:hypothetical protein